MKIVYFSWVRERIGSIPEHIAFEQGAVMQVRGEPHALHFKGLRTRGRRIESTPADTPQSYATLTVNGPTEHAAQRLTDWLFSEARRDLDARVVHHAGRLGLKAKRITVRDQSSRWGSCSTTGTLSFSWRLILAPP